MKSFALWTPCQHQMIKLRMLWTGHGREFSILGLLPAYWPQAAPPRQQVCNTFLHVCFVQKDHGEHCFVTLLFFVTGERGV